MMRLLTHNPFIQDTQGYSLLETVVATTLIATVLIPMGGLAVYLLTLKQNDPYLVALALGETMMEQTLHERSYNDAVENRDEGRWQLIKTVHFESNQVVIRVKVYRRNRPKPLVELMTLRLLR